GDESLILISDTASAAASAPATVLLAFEMLLDGARHRGLTVLLPEEQATRLSLPALSIDSSQLYFQLDTSHER
ncbi:MAG: hypothetical protein ACRD10_02230, partial [Terriglobia bacterium]